jgi:hypothetical protein
MKPAWELKKKAEKARHTEKAEANHLGHPHITTP